MTLVSCVQISNLPIVLARRDDSRLATPPLVLYMFERGRAVVYAASENADVAPGMPLHRARVRSPHASYLPAEPERDRQIVAALVRLLSAFSPRVAEVGSLPDVALALDLGRVTLSQAMALTERIAQRISAALHVVPAIGIGRNRLIAVHAARCAGAGVAVLVPPGSEQSFLTPQSITTLDLETELVERLERLGLRTVGDVARVPLDALQAQFGGAGLRLYQLAHGTDEAPIPVTPESQSISRTRRFAEAVLDRGALEQVITALATRIATQLASDGWSAGAIELTLALDDGAPARTERILPESTSDPTRLTATLIALSRVASIESGVTAVTVTASNLVPVVTEQLELFGPAGGQAKQLRAILERLGGRFSESLLRAELADPAARLPERRVRLEPR